MGELTAVSAVLLAAAAVKGAGLGKGEICTHAEIESAATVAITMRIGGIAGAKKFFLNIILTLNSLKALPYNLFGLRCTRKGTRRKIVSHGGSVWRGKL